MQVVQSSVSIGPVSGNGPQIQNTTVNFPNSVQQATAVLTGFNVEYSGNNDHHLGLLEVQVNVQPGGLPGTSVQVGVTYGLRDFSGNWDDQYDGTIFFAVIGE
jgi:hypothetical protein